MAKIVTRNLADNLRLNDGRWKGGVSIQVADDVQVAERVERGAIRNRVRDDELDVTNPDPRRHEVKWLI